MSSIFFSSGISTCQSTNTENLSPNRAQLFLRNKYTVFTMGGTVALRSVSKRRATVLQLIQSQLWNREAVLLFC